MKKLMFAALAAVAVGAAYADTRAYVYQVYMDIKTTQSVPCSGDPGKAIECGYNPGAAYNYVRVLDDYTVKGYIYLCFNGCAHLYHETSLDPVYSKEGQNAHGIILWESRKQAKVVPQGAGAWSFALGDRAGTGADPVLRYRFLNVNSVDFDRCEGVFDFKADVLLATANKGIVTNTFNMVGAGFGLYDTVLPKTDKDDGKFVWTRQTGLMAGTMTAPWMFNDDGLVIDGTQAFGYVCGQVCGGTKSWYGSDTAANGTYTISYNDAVSQDYGLRYTEALKDFVPEYAGWVQIPPKN